MQNCKEHICKICSTLTLAYVYTDILTIFSAGIKKTIFSYLYVRISGYKGAAGPWNGIRGSSHSPPSSCGALGAVGSSPGGGILGCMYDGPTDGAVHPMSPHTSPPSFGTGADGGWYDISGIVPRTIGAPVFRALWQPLTSATTCYERNKSILPVH
jgi:hypothetical protein